MRERQQLDVFPKVGRLEARLEKPHRRPVSLHLSVRPVYALIIKFEQYVMIAMTQHCVSSRRAALSRNGKQADKPYAQMLQPTASRVTGSPGDCLQLRDPLLLAGAFLKDPWLSV